MADFGYLSDTDDSAVDELISQVKDLSVLEQVSKINCASFTDSLLPPDLENRFHKLKSFPLSTPRTALSVNSKANFSCSVSDDETDIFSTSKACPSEKESSFKHGLGIFLDTKQHPDGKSPTGEEIFLPFEENPVEEKGLKKKYKPGLCDDSSSSWIEDFISSPSKHKSEKMRMKVKNKSGCFWCSPKKKKKNKEKWDADSIINNNKVDEDEFLSVFDTFSYKEQQKILKKAMKEEEKISKEAEKIVELAKQASNRMHGIEDENSDDDKGKF